MRRERMLVSLWPGYGMGDAVRASVVLRHLAKYRPHWTIDYQAEEGRHQAGRGIVDRTFARGDPYPDTYYDQEEQLVFYDVWQAFTDRPNTCVTQCLLDRFGLDWDAECGRYAVQVRNYVARVMGSFVGRKSVAIHYKGDSAPDSKDLTDAQALEICGTVLSLGYFPLLLDWRNTSRIRNHRRIRSMGGFPDSLLWGKDVEYNCAVIAQCSAFVGIDSGPAKCASATDTPSLVVWTDHHPARYHDPAPNTTHLVKGNFHDMPPVCGDPDVIRWFDANYEVRRYGIDPVPHVAEWLKRVLR